MDASDYPWAEACLPFGGDYDIELPGGFGIIFIPRVESTVWLMYEAGEPDRPVWLGSPYANSFKKKPETPVEALSAYPDVFLIKSPGSDGNYIKFTFNDDTDRSLEIAVSDETKLTLSKGEDGDSVVLSCDSSISVTSSEGQLRLSGGSVVISSDGDVRVTAGGNITTRSVGSTVFSVDEEAQLRAAAKSVGGFQSR